MHPIQDKRFLRAIRHEPVDRTPIWIMRQAGRYLPEYRALRAKAGSFLTLCKTPELACQVTLQPLERFALDAAIIFSDILTIPDAMGLGLFFREGEGPGFTNPLRAAHDIHALGVPDPDLSLGYVLDAIRMVKQELKGEVPLIGFCGSPWTLATYMVEGNANKAFPAIQALLREEPRVLHHLLNTLAKAVGLHLSAQIEAGADAVMLFDTWGGLLKTEDYIVFSLAYVKEIIAEIKMAHPNNPIILFTKNGSNWLNLMAETGCDVLGIDAEVHLTKARAAVGHRVALQGNMAPSILYQSNQQIEGEVKRILAEYGKGPGHIFNLAHGVPKDVSPEKVSILVEAVWRYSRVFHD